MAHYAFIDDDNIVVEVITGNDEYIGGPDWERFYSEQRGMRCLKTSYNVHGGVHSWGRWPLRMNFAAIGYSYDEGLDAFIPPRPFPSWVLDESTCLWNPPVPMPSDDMYTWDESELKWVLANLP